MMLRAKSSNCMYCVLLCLCLVICLSVRAQEADLPCAERRTGDTSMVCVCNATYCDTITRVSPACRTYVAYTTAENGKRFHKTYGPIREYSYGQRANDSIILELRPNVLYQEISGFGSSPTDAAGINWMRLPEEARLRMVESYFGKSGIEYSMMRVPIGGTDFSTHPYAYNENSTDLNDFTLAREDYEYKIPLIKASMEAAQTPIRIIASLWSPPTWMKTEDSYISGYLKAEHYQTLADYFCKFFESYQQFDIDMWGVTTTNEPLNGLMGIAPLNRIRWNVEDMGWWLLHNFGPTLRNSTFRDIKIIAGDDQRFTLPMWFNMMISIVPECLQYIDGVASHWYFDDYAPADILSYALKDHTDKFLIYTEACEGYYATPELKVDLGSWYRGTRYANNIIDVINNGAIGWIDWNMCLDLTGGPNWVHNNVDSPIIISDDGVEFYKQPMFYVMGHFSKFIPRGSRRIQVISRWNSLSLPNVAFLTPEGTIVVNLLNVGQQKSITLKNGEDNVRITLDSNSMTTVEFPHHSQC